MSFEPGEIKYIDLQGIAERIAEKCGCPDVEAREFILAFTKTFHALISREGRVSVPGIGMFEYHGGDALVFRASERLENEVNAAFSMFSPVEIPGDMIGVFEEINSTESSSLNAARTSVSPSVNEDGKINGEDTRLAKDEHKVDYEGEAIDESNGEEKHQENLVLCDPEPAPERVENSGIENKSAILSQPSSENGDSAESEPFSESGPVLEREEREFLETSENEDSQDFNHEDAQESDSSDEDDCLLPEEETDDWESNIPCNAGKHHHISGWLGYLLGIVTGLGIAACMWFFLFPQKLKPTEGVSSDSIKETMEVGTINVNHLIVNNEEKTLLQDTVKGDGREESVENKAIADGVPTEVTDTVNSRRFLTTMAKKHYGDKRLWVYIYEENKSKLRHPDRIAPGTVVVIPPIEKYIRPGSSVDSISRATSRKVGEIYSRYPD